MNGKSWTLSAFVIAIVFVGGCNQVDSDATSQSASDASEQEHAHGGHDLHGYWCVEHGVPEEICAQCDPKLAAEFQAKGDWCEEHGRPDSQCFIHHSELQAKFAAQYEAKFGEQPPQPEAE